MVNFKARNLKAAKKIAKKKGYYIGSVVYNKSADKKYGTDTLRVFSAARRFK